MITIEKMNKFYSDFHALKDIDLAVEEGQRIVLCGPSGSGKSTLIRCLNGLETFESGTVTVVGIKMTRSSQAVRKARQQVGMVFQSFNLFPHLSVLNNLLIAPRLTGARNMAETREYAMHLLERVRIADQAGKYPSELSGGQQQRVAIARALCMRPKVMLFDEPTSALDPEMIKEVLDVMIDLGRDGMTMIAVTHEMGFAKTIADKVVFMDAGRIVETAAPDVFFSNPQTERAQRFLHTILH
ncbi:amino acid ABC transporter ATP-binding protein [Pseudaminobacter arsenicus]|uniref:Amino acid ABC transporter ATP-binding protein n=1 Tax=Borborobacter arsenicus TaxID=1851146 RepID=A0A432V1G4_9HYPH|nr:amino acid ABC transporter ATP-binding protein [Pseudaminobacter arsenicus]RUM96010.1 amino acid ABC transporter ATP-binding protein [Pseudaminobacter arsenicus]